MRALCTSSHVAKCHAKCKHSTFTQSDHMCMHACAHVCMCVRGEGRVEITTHSLLQDFSHTVCLTGNLATGMQPHGRAF